ncbi:hypothetical protein FR943_24795 [Mycobacterium sp. TNTM28]|uniref:Uncharacterized protein n=1 Tax=[Mycobacterium] fortunisiensis TaxID=2600579 RepID=A0ABS6KTY9_9MYCO|nr:hypothetical protein [[Mycobacterium] fortunisiensis]MBU9767041.1 hypothetical protein [[Mycobacterium] fortunisiensis]
MGNVPVSGPYAEYCGSRFLILSSGDGWVALRADSEAEVPNAFERGESCPGTLYAAPWAKVPTAALDEIVDVDVTGSLAGHRVSLRNLLSDGRIRVWFIGDPAVAEDIGLKGDRHDGWTGSFDPEDFSDIQIVETRRV